MRKPDLSFNRIGDLSWEAHIDDICYELNLIEDFLAEFIFETKSRLPDADIEIYERKHAEYEYQDKKINYKNYITEFKINITFETKEEEAQFIILKSNGII